MNTMKKNTCLKLIFAATLVALLFVVFPVERVYADIVTSDIFITQIHLPDGARIDYLRIYYYDDSIYNQTGYITTYKNDHSYEDLISASSSGAPGYGSALSSYSGHVVNNYTNTYVLNWRPRLFSGDMRLVRMRVAYKVAGDFGGPWHYLSVAGSNFLPRDHNHLDLYIGWGYGGYGSIYAKADNFLNYLPFIHE